MILRHRGIAIRDNTTRLRVIFTALKGDILGDIAPSLLKDAV